MTLKSKPRRYKALAVAPDLVAEIVTHSHRRSFVSYEFDGLPDDAELQYTYYDASSDTFRMIFWHESFDEVAIGDQIPLAEVSVTMVDSGVPSR